MKINANLFFFRKKLTDCARELRCFLRTPVYFGCSPSRVPPRALVFFPLLENRLCCGLAGIVTFGRVDSAAEDLKLEAMQQAVQMLEAHGLQRSRRQDLEPAAEYLGGDERVRALLADACGLKRLSRFAALFGSREKQVQLQQIAGRLDRFVKQEEQLLSDQVGLLKVETVEVLSARIELLKDIAWCLSAEVLDNLSKTRKLAGADEANGFWSPERIRIYKNINAVLNSIDRLEVRGRDSAGLSLMFILERPEFERFEKTLKDADLLPELESRSRKEVLINGDIHVHARAGSTDNLVTITFTYKVAAEIGRLGDNIRFMRRQIQNDAIFHCLATCEHRFHTVSSHTRWASVGAITEANCHPLDNAVIGARNGGCGIIHVCLNGDIDNYMQLRSDLEVEGVRLHDDVTTDTKIIPLQIEKYIRQGQPVEDAFRLAVNDFEGSHAISMHTDLAPGKLFLAQKGSGQTIFIGLAENHFMPTSEVYGFVEETDRFLKLDGEKIVPGRQGDTQGQIVILDQSAAGGVESIRGMYYDGTELVLSDDAVKRTAITSRDIDRQDFPHYFLKEISESPQSVEKTLQNRWKIQPASGAHDYRITLDETTVPARIRQALGNDTAVTPIRRIFFVGQGTAGIAAKVCADLMQYYLDDPMMQIRALKASELSGFGLKEIGGSRSMEDALVIAISQSGTTTDTNRTVDMVRERGAHTLAIVNRRDSDITFKVDGVMYTSSGRDIEMSVASTKAFYSQIVAGALLGLYFAEQKGRRDREFVTAEIKNLLALPEQMRCVLEMRAEIEASARRLATGRTYWAAVGSGPNKAAADEIRIKLSELCYKTISSDFVEDKKHIDLSSEPLIIVCAAGTRGTVIGDIVKDTAIFKAHKATPVVITERGERRFDPYADSVFYVPAVAEHLAPILNTLVGHLWGYYAALTINEGSSFLFRFQQDLKNTLEEFTARAMDLYEVILEKSFKEKVAAFYGAFRRNKIDQRFPTIMGIEAASDLTLLLKYLAGRLPASDFEVDFGVKGTPSNMLNCLFQCLGECINAMARPVDAIKHQAKTVTVGTSRISEKLAGLLFDILARYGFTPAQVTPGNIHVLKNLQDVVAEVKGAIRYRISELTLLGEPTEDSRIEVEQKDGVLAPIPSRVETDTTLKGTKKIIVRQGNVYIGKGRKDDRSILVIPIISTNPETPNLIEHLLLLNITFQDSVPLPVKVKALGGKYEHIKNIVQENSVPWKDEHLQMVDMDELFGRSAEKIAEFIVAELQRPEAGNLRPAAGS